MVPPNLGIEIAFSLLTIILCFAIYLKTKESYELTKHKGILHFRNTFLFFGLAYFSRFLFYIIAFGFYIPRQMLGPLFLIPVGYFSMMAIFSLIYSTLWKKLNSDYFMIIANILALGVGIYSFIPKSPFKLLILQTALLILALILSFIIHKKKFSQIHVIYILIFIFWFVSLFTIIPGRMIPFEFKLVFQMISLGVFIILYYKVLKWLK